MRSIALLALILLAGSASAGLITVDYQKGSVAGSFSGDDLNDDGWLTLGELDSWSINYNGGAQLAELDDIGDFDYVNNVWLHNGRKWDQTTKIAYMTWGNWDTSLIANWNFETSVDIQTVEPVSEVQDPIASSELRTSENVTEVPEPFTIGLLALGLAGLGFSRKRKTA